jgi:hypothetical protein
VAAMNEIGLMVMLGVLGVAWLYAVAGKIGRWS